MTTTVTNDLTARQVAKLESLSYATPPRNQGQIVEVSYAGVPDGCGGGCVVQRTHDRGTGEVTYAVADWTDEDFQPWQTEPAGDFAEIDSRSGVLRMI